MYEQKQRTDTYEVNNNFLLQNVNLLHLNKNRIIYIISISTDSYNYKSGKLKSLYFMKTIVDESFRVWKYK